MCELLSRVPDRELVLSGHQLLLPHSTRTESGHPMVLLRLPRAGGF